MLIRRNLRAPVKGRLAVWARVSRYLCLGLLGAGLVWGQGAVITLPGGQVSLGIATFGQLGAGALPAGSNDAGSPYGIYLAVQHGDAIAPGCFCEGWGASGNAITGYAGNDNGGNVNVTGVSFVSTATTATAVVTLTSLPGLQITQAYAPSLGAPTVLFEDTVTLKNTSAATITDVRYARAMDWDIPPTEFNEDVTIGGLPASKLLYSSDDGFCTPDPLNSAACSPGAGTLNTNFVKNGPADHGAVFVFKFGDLAPGAAVTFKIYYGAGTNEAAALGGLTGVGAEVYSLGYASNGPGGTANTSSGVWVFGFAGVGGTAIGGAPIPIGLPSLFLICIGLGVAAWLQAKRRSVSHG